MTRRGCIQYRNFHTIVHNLKHFRYQLSGIERHCLTRLQIDFHIISLFHMTDTFLQQLKIVVLPRDMMPSAKVHPFHLVEIFPEFLLDYSQCRRQIIRILLAQRMEMKSVQFTDFLFCQLCLHLLQSRSQS